MMLARAFFCPTALAGRYNHGGVGAAASMSGGPSSGSSSNFQGSGATDPGNNSCSSSSAGADSSAIPPAVAPAVPKASSVGPVESHNACVDYDAFDESSDSDYYISAAGFAPAQKKRKISESKQIAGEPASDEENLLGDAEEEENLLVDAEEVSEFLPQPAAMAAAENGIDAAALQQGYADADFNTADREALAAHFRVHDGDIYKDIMAGLAWAQQQDIQRSNALDAELDEQGTSDSEV